MWFLKYVLMNIVWLLERKRLCLEHLHCEATATGKSTVALPCSCSIVCFWFSTKIKPMCWNQRSYMAILMLREPVEARFSVLLFFVSLSIVHWNKHVIRMCKNNVTPNSAPTLWREKQINLNKKKKMVVIRVTNHSQTNMVTLNTIIPILYDSVFSTKTISPQWEPLK